MLRRTAAVLVTTLLTLLAGLLLDVPGSQVRAQESAAGGQGRTVLLLDASGSMAEPAGGGQTRIEAAREALTKVVGELPDDAVVGMRVFGADVFSRTDPGACRDSRLVVEPATGNREELLDAVGSYEPYGETPIPHALRAAAADLGDDGPRTIVLVSDGESTCDPDPCVVAGDIAQQGIDVRIDVVGLSVSGKARDQLRCVAERGRGTYRDAEGAADIVTTLTRVAERAVRPFVLSGQPIEGGPEDAPTEVTVGDWTDELGPWKSADEARHYVVRRTTPDSTIRVSAITQGESGDDGIKLEVTGPDGALCDNGVTIRQIDTRRVIGVQVVAGPETDCAEPGDHVIRVERRLATEGTAAFGLRVTEEPPVSDTGFSGSEEIEVVAPRVRGAVRPVAGAQSFATAAEIGPGRWGGALVPGETTLYRLPLNFGQAARVAVTFAEPAPAARRAMGGEYVLGNIVLYNPMQGQLAHPDGATFSGRVGSERMTFLTATPRVSRDLVDTGGFNGVEDYSTAGDYYLAVSAMRGDHGVEMPFTVEVEVVGGAADGPTYADGATWSVADGVSGGPEQDSSATPTPEPEGSPSGAERAAAAPDGDQGGLPVVALAGIAVLVVVVGGAVVVSRRRGT